MDYYHQGKRVRESSGTTDKTEARNILQSKIGQRAEGRLVIGADGVTFADLMEMVVTDYKVNGKKSLINVRVKIRKHLAPFFGSMRANKITTADVERFIVHRQEQGASNVEINRETALLWYGGTLAKRPDFPARWCTISGGRRSGTWSVLVSLNV